MTLEKIADNIVETDVLVIGGGIGGCPAAAKAREHGLDVTLVEKAKTERSGSAGQGIDHYGTFPREGITELDIVKAQETYESTINGDGRWVDPNITYRMAKKAFWTLEELEKLGIPMKWDDGELHFIPIYWYQGLPTLLRVHWQNIKPLMAVAVKKRGVRVLDRTMVVDLLTNKGTVVGATAVNTRTGEFIVIKAKATVIATGMFARCYDGETPLFYKYKFRIHWCPATVSGDGWAAAYRAGADLINMDITGWHFRNRDDLTISFGNFGINDGIPAHYLTWDGDELLSILPTDEYAELEQKGKTPLYRSLEWHPDDYFKRMQVAFADERLVSFKICEERMFNPRTHRYEFMTNKPLNFVTRSGLYIDEYFKASLKGLYAIGDCAAGCMACNDAAIGGFLVGDNIHTYVSHADEPVVDEGQVESQKQTALAPLSVKDGTEPMELECSIRYICERYAGQFKSEGKLREGLRRLGSMRRVFLPKLMAKNPHYLMRALEARNILDLADLHLQASLERNETRGSFIRLDCPKKDPTLDNLVTIQRIEEGKAVLERREVPKLKPAYAKEGN